MKGAQGLLISITGGRDLTLFEVDEAATRIREEVDPDANIILGATFDEALEGLIRVSVVATGIDRGVQSVDLRAAEMRAASKPIIRPSAAIAAASAPAQPAPQPAPVMQAAPAPVAQPVAQQQPAVDPIAEQIRLAEAEMERELAINEPQRVAPAPQPVAQQQQEEFRPASRLFAAPAEPQAPVMTRPAPVQAPAQPQPAPVMQQPVAPRPAAPVFREPAAPSVSATVEPVRMPKVEDFPPIVKAEMDQRSQPVQHVQEERGPMGLLKRITSSLGRREEEEPAHVEPAAPAAPVAQRRPLSAEASMYAPRRGNLDDHGRAVPQSHQEDDQLEIPAFLRRQSN
jgi:cell division protein FtsZ